MANKTINEGLLDRLRKGIKQSFSRGLDKKIENPTKPRQTNHRGG